MLPVPIQWDTSHASCQASKNGLELIVPLVNDTLKYFYPDYKDYYYLIYEDMAVHKSVGEYVERSARKKATAQTCYTKKDRPLPPAARRSLVPLFQKGVPGKTGLCRVCPHPL